MRILATSREPLRAEGEKVYRVPPLASPPASPRVNATEALSFPAVQLFVERAASTLGEFELSNADAPLVAEICRKLDGIPLATYVPCSCCWAIPRLTAPSGISALRSMTLSP